MQLLSFALRDSGVRNLTVVSNNAGVDDWGLGLLLNPMDQPGMRAAKVDSAASLATKPEVICSG